MLINDSNAINRIKSESYELECDNRIWTFPRFIPDGDSCSFPDPRDFCVGIYLQPLSSDQSLRTLSRQEPSGRLSTIETLMEVPDEIEVDGFNYQTTFAAVDSHKDYMDIDLNLDTRVVELSKN